MTTPNQPKPISTATGATLSDKPDVDPTWQPSPDLPSSLDGAITATGGPRAH